MALILSNKSYHMGFRDVICDILFGDYNFGGESFKATDISMAKIHKVNIEPVKGYTFEFDYANNRIKVFKKAPPIVIEEVQTIADHAITLNYPAAAIINMASGTATQLLIEPSDTLPGNGVQLAAAMTDGARPTFTFHDSTSGDIKTTYITQAWQEVWVNRFASVFVETGGTHIAQAGETLCFVESMLADGTTGSSRPLFTRKEDPPDTGECEIDWADDGASVAHDTTFTFKSTDAIDDITYTGIILPASGFLKERFVEDEDLTMDTGGTNIGASAFPILFPAICGQIPDYTNAAEEVPHHLMMPSGDLCETAGEWRIDWHLTKTLAGHQIDVLNVATDAVSLTYVKGFMAEIPGLVRLEVPDGTDLSELSGVKAHILGR